MKAAATHAGGCLRRPMSAFLRGEQASRRIPLGSAKPYGGTLAVIPSVAREG